MSKNQKLIFPSAKNWYGDGNENVAKSFIDQILQNKKYTLTKAVRLMNESYPDDQTTPQNVSNKIKRGTIDFIEVARIAEICGYQLAFIPIDEAAHEDDSTIAPRVKQERTSAENQIRESHRPIRIKDDVDKEETGEHTDISFIEAVNQGCAVVKRKHSGEFIFAGKRAKEAAQAYEEHNTVDGDSTGNPQHTEMREISLAAYIELMFGVQFRIVF